MKTYRFTVAEHEEYGMKGFRPTWYQNGDPLSGMAVAHDILSHFPHDDGRAEGEFLALGADLFIRGDSGYFQRNGNINSPEEHLSAEFGMIWGLHTDRDRRTSVKPCGLTRDDRLMAQCREIVQLGVKEMADGWGHLTPPDAETRERIARWYARGYVKARKRYGNRSSGDIAYSLFGPIEEQADRALKHADDGMVLTVQVDIKNLTVRVECEYPDQEEY